MGSTVADSERLYALFFSNFGRCCSAHSRSRWNMHTEQTASQLFTHCGICVSGRSKAIAICQSSALFNEDKAINFIIFHYYFFQSALCWTHAIMVHDDGALRSHAHDHRFTFATFSSICTFLSFSSPISVRRFSWMNTVNKHFFFWSASFQRNATLTSCNGLAMEKLPSVGRF